MNKQMFLLEVRDDKLFKRRISDSLGNIEDWIDANAQSWALLPIEVEHDGFGNGRIYLKEDKKCVLYTFSTKNIAVI